MFPFTPLENFGFDFVKYHDLSSKIVNNICGINTVICTLTYLFFSEVTRYI